MTREIKRIKLFVKSDIQSKNIATMLRDELIKNNFFIVDNDFELGIAIGGDGTYLKMVHESDFNNEIYYAGINTGTLGFLSTINPKFINEFINSINNNSFKIYKVIYLSTDVITSNNEYHFLSLNEIVVRKSDLNVLRFNIEINNNLLEYTKADGLIISTPTGSTAYNLSLNGAIIDNTLNAISIMPIAPVRNKTNNSLLNPLIMNGKTAIKLIFNKDDITLIYDGKMKCINNVLQVETKAIKTINCLMTNDYDFIKLINDKIIN